MRVPQALNDFDSNSLWDKLPAEFRERYDQRSSCSAWAASLQPRITSDSLNLEPLDEYSQFTVQQIPSDTGPAAWHEQSLLTPFLQDLNSALT
jgi:hypothetical protein